MCVSIYVSMYVCMCVCMYVCMHACMYTYAHTYVRICMNVYMYISMACAFTQTHTPPGHYTAAQSCCFEPGDCTWIFRLCFTQTHVLTWSLHSGTVVHSCAPLDARAEGQQVNGLFDALISTPERNCAKTSSESLVNWFELRFLQKTYTVIMWSICGPCDT